MNDDKTTMHLSEQQSSIVVGLERAGASLSMIGVLLVIITFGLFKRLRTVPNTFILFASMANIGASTASLIGLSGIGQGSDSSLCRAQAFLLEMFMQSDSWWSFAMAFNVYLVFFHSANPTTFRRHLWVYCLACFGLPMIPAVVCLYVQNASRGPVYGDATLWCWIGDSWNALRIYSYYIPIWMCIFFSSIIYMAVGYHVFHQRNQLRNLTLSNQAKDLSSFEVKDSADKILNSRVYGTVTTEVQITRDVCESALRCERSPPKTPLGSSMQCPWTEETSPLHSERMDKESTGELATYMPVNHDFHSDTSTVYRVTSTTIITSPSPSYGFASIIQDQPPSVHRNCHFDTALSTHRLQQGFSRAPRSHFHCTSTSNTRENSRSSASLGDRIRAGWQHFFGKLQHMDPVKLAYLRTSFVFAISVLVTWAPSSINRVYTLVHPARNSYGLNIASAAVLPLQGVWNAVIYFSTSWNLLRQETSQAYAQRTWLQIFSHRRKKTNGILADGLVTYQATTIVPSPVLSPARTHCGSRTHVDLTEVGEDTESDGYEGLGLFESSRPDYFSGNCRLWQTAGIDLNASTRSSQRNLNKAPQRGNLRIQRGGQLDS